MLLINLSPLHLAVQTGNAEIVGLFASLEKTDLNSTDNEGQAAIHIAVKLNKLDIVQALCTSHRIDKNLRDRIFLLTLVLSNSKIIFCF